MKLHRVTLLSLRSNGKVKFQATFEVSRGFARAPSGTVAAPMVIRRAQIRASL